MSRDRDIPPLDLPDLEQLEVYLMQVQRDLHRFAVSLASMVHLHGSDDIIEIPRKTWDTVCNWEETRVLVVDDVQHSDKVVLYWCTPEDAERYLSNKEDMN